MVASAFISYRLHPQDCGQLERSCTDGRAALENNSSNSFRRGEVDVSSKSARKSLLPGASTVKQYLLSALLIGFFMAMANGTSFAASPNYVLLRVESPSLSHHSVHGNGPNVAQTPAAQPYAYGWFGVPPRKHWSRHFGFYREYTQWSGK